MREIKFRAWLKEERKMVKKFMREIFFFLEMKT